MRTQPYALKGKDVPEQFAGQTINIRLPESSDECQSLFADAEARDESAHNDYVVWLQGRLRAMSGAKNEDGTLKYSLSELQAFADKATKARRVPGTGSTKEVKPETKQARAAKGAGNKLFEKCRADAAFLARMVKLGAVEQADYDEWLAAQPQA